MYFWKLLSAMLIWLFYAGASRYIIQTHIIIFRKQDNSVKRNYYLSAFVFAVMLLGRADYPCDLFLCQIMVFTQIPKSGLIISHKFYLGFLLYLYNYTLFADLLLTLSLI